MAKSPKDYSKLLKAELVDLAKKAGLTGLGSLTKDEIITRLSKAGRAIEDKLLGPARRRAPAAKAIPAAGKDRSAAATPSAGKGPARGAVKSAPPRSAAATAPNKTAAAKARPTAASAKTAGTQAAPPSARRTSPGTAAAAAGAPGAETRTASATSTCISAMTTTTATASAATAAAASESTSAPLVGDLDAGLPELPEGYADNRIVLLPRDPQWLYAYWDVTHEHKLAARRRGGLFLCLRLYDVTDVTFDGANAHAMWEQEVHELARNWYLHVPSPGRRYCLEIGYRGAEGQWLPLARSNTVPAPVDRPAERIHDEFATIPLDRPLPSSTTAPAAGAGGGAGLHDLLLQAGRAAGLAPGASRSGEAAWSAAAGAWSGAWSGAVEAWSGAWSATAASLPPAPAPGLRLNAEVELIVHGMTAPGAKVRCGGRPVQAGPDGSFLLRLRFPDGEHDLPIEATSGDGAEACAVRFTFQRRTG